MNKKFIKKILLILLFTLAGILISSSSTTQNVFAGDNCCTGTNCSNFGGNWVAGWNACQSCGCSGPGSPCSKQCGSNPAPSSPAPKCTGASNCQVNCNDGTHSFKDACPANGAFKTCDAWADQACGPYGGHGGNTSTNVSNNGQGVGTGACVISGCQPGYEYWKGHSGYCNTCQNGCTVRAADQNSCKGGDVPIPSNNSSTNAVSPKGTACNPANSAPACHNQCDFVGLGGSSGCLCIINGPNNQCGCVIGGVSPACGSGQFGKSCNDANGREINPKQQSCSSLGLTVSGYTVSTPGDVCCVKVDSTGVHGATCQTDKGVTLNSGTPDFCCHDNCPTGTQPFCTNGVMTCHSGFQCDCGNLNGGGCGTGNTDKGCSKQADNTRLCEDSSGHPFEKHDESCGIARGSSPNGSCITTGQSGVSPLDCCDANDQKVKFTTPYGTAMIQCNAPTPGSCIKDGSSSTDATLNCCDAKVTKYTDTSHSGVTLYECFGKPDPNTCTATGDVYHGECCDYPNAIPVVLSKDLTKCLTSRPLDDIATPNSFCSNSKGCACLTAPNGQIDNKAFCPPVGGGGQCINNNECISGNCFQGHCQPVGGGTVKDCVTKCDASGGCVCPKNCSNVIAKNKEICGGGPTACIAQYHGTCSANCGTDQDDVPGTDCTGGLKCCAPLKSLNSCTEQCTNGTGCSCPTSCSTDGTSKKISIGQICGGGSTACDTGYHGTCKPVCGGNESSIAGTDCGILTCCTPLKSLSSCTEQCTNGTGCSCPTSCDPKGQSKKISFGQICGGGISCSDHNGTCKAICGNGDKIVPDSDCATTLTCCVPAEETTNSCEEPCKNSICLCPTNCQKTGTVNRNGNCGSTLCSSNDSCSKYGEVCAAVANGGICVKPSDGQVLVNGKTYCTNDQICGNQACDISTHTCIPVQNGDELPDGMYCTGDGVCSRANQRCGSHNRCVAPIEGGLLSGARIYCTQQKTCDQSEVCASGNICMPKSEGITLLDGSIHCTNDNTCGNGKSCDLSIDKCIQQLNSCTEQCTNGTGCLCPTNCDTSLNLVKNKIQIVQKTISFGQICGQYNNSCTNQGGTCKTICENGEEEVASSDCGGALKLTCCLPAKETTNSCEEPCKNGSCLCPIGCQKTGTITSGQNCGSTLCYSTKNTCSNYGEVCVPISANQGICTKATNGMTLIDGTKYCTDTTVCGKTKSCDTVNHMCTEPHEGDTMADGLTYCTIDTFCSNDNSIICNLSINRCTSPGSVNPGKNCNDSSGRCLCPSTNTLIPNGVLCQLQPIGGSCSNDNSQCQSNLCATNQCILPQGLLSINPGDYCPYYNGCKCGNLYVKGPTTDTPRGDTCPLIPSGSIDVGCDPDSPLVLKPDTPGKIVGKSAMCASGWCNMGLHPTNAPNKGICFGEDEQF